MTDLDLATIRARVAATTPDPWVVDADACTVDTSDGRALVTVLLGDSDTRDAPRQSLADCAFIAHARTDVPALLAEVDLLRALVAGANWCDCGIGASRDNSSIATMPHADDCPARDRVLAAEVDRLDADKRRLSAALAEAESWIDNLTAERVALRGKLLTALRREDDGHTSLSEYVDAIVARLIPSSSEESR